MEEIASYFKKGFHLANKNLDLYLISLIMSIVDYSFIINDQLWTETKDPLVLMGLSVLSLCFALLLASFYLSWPGIITERQEGKKISVLCILKISLISAKRLILPGAVLLVAAMAIFIILVIIMIVVFHLPISSNPVNFNSPITAIIFYAIITCLSYIAIFFSVEHQGLFSSIKNSVIYSTKNLLFTGILFLYGIMFHYIFTFVQAGAKPGSLSFILHSTGISFITDYVGLIAVGITLLYYQNHKNLAKSK